MQTKEGKRLIVFSLFSYNEENEHAGADREEKKLV